MVYLVVTSILWSFSFGLIKAQLTGLDPYLVSLIRLLLSFLVFLPFLRRAKLGISLKLMGIGMIQFGLMYCLYIYSYRFLQGHQVALLTITTPLFVVFIDAMLKRHWIARYWAAALLAILAALVISWDQSSTAMGIRGVLLLQAANLCFALGQLLYKDVGKRLSGEHHYFAWLYLGALAAPILFLGVRGFQGVALPTALGQWLSLLYLGLIPSGLGFFLWNKGVVRVNSGTAAAMNNLKVPLGALAAWTLFGETMDPFTFGAGALLLGIALFLAKRK